jgi:hypothetical protein
MVRHWIGIQRHGKSGGVLTCGSFITCIAANLGLDYSAYHQSPPPRIIELTTLRSYGWVTFTRATASAPRVITWLTEHHGSFVLPYYAPIRLDDDRTWRLELDPADLEDDDAETDDEEDDEGVQAEEDVPMEDADPAVPQDDPPAPHMPPHMPHEAPTDWSWPQFYSMMTGMQQVQLETRDSVRSVQSEQERQRQTLLDIRTQVGSIDTRLASLEVEFASFGLERRGGDPGAGPSDPCA